MSFREHQSFEQQRRDTKQGSKGGDRATTAAVGLSGCKYILSRRGSTTLMTTLPAGSGTETKDRLTSHPAGVMHRMAQVVQAAGGDRGNPVLALTSQLLGLHADRLLGRLRPVELLCLSHGLLGLCCIGGICSIRTRAVKWIGHRHYRP
jgi:hypothetical protein